MFRRLSIPTPFQVGPVNAYLAGRTLIDPGPDSEDARAALADALAEEWLGLDDLERVAITHPHPDHFGMAGHLRDRGATIVASPEAAAVVADFEERLADEQRYFSTLFRRHGVAATTVEAVTELPAAFLPYAPDCEVDRILSDGDVLTVEGTEITVESVEGHAPGELLFTYRVDGETRSIVGDHVLGSVTPNPLLQPPEEPGGERPRVLPAYNRSLDRLRERSFDRLLPGHGEPIDDPAERIAEIRRANDERTANVRSIVDGLTTAATVAEELFGDLPATEHFPAMSEAIGHLDVLEERGEVRRLEDGDRIAYEPA